MRLVIALFLGWVVVFGSTGVVYSEDPTEKEIEKLIEEEKRQLEDLKKKIDRQAREISTMGKKESKILKNLDTLESKKKVRERELQIYRWNIKINNKQMDLLSRKIKITEKQLARQKLIVGRRLRSLYKEGKEAPIKILFSSNNYSQLIQKLKYMDLFLAYDSRVFKNYENRWEQYKDEENKLKLARKRMEQFQNAALHKTDEIKKETENKTRFLKEIKNKRVYFIQTRKELLKASENLNDLISKLEDKKMSGEQLSFADKKGRLFYPVNGKILNRFGRIRDPRFDSYIINNGLNLEVDKGTKVYPIFQGPVLFAGSLEGYGNLVILGHGDHYHSLYGHLEKVFVTTGDMAYENQPIGLSGDTGSLVGETLYLELRKDGKPIDPVPWLQTAQSGRN